MRTKVGKKIQTMSSRKSTNMYASRPFLRMISIEGVLMKVGTQL